MSEPCNSPLLDYKIQGVKGVEESVLGLCHGLCWGLFRWRCRIGGLRCHIRLREAWCVCFVGCRLWFGGRYVFVDVSIDDEIVLGVDVG
jgi:hypothetical protein